MEGWIEEALAGMENALRAGPRDLRGACERELAKAFPGPALGMGPGPCLVRADRWRTLAVALDCCARGALGGRLARSGKARTAEAVLEEVLVHRFGVLGRVRASRHRRPDEGLVFTSRRCTATVRAYGLA